MVQFVVQKKYTKYDAGSMSSSGVPKKISSYVRKIPIAYFWAFFGLLVLFYGVFLLLKYTIFVPEYRIVKVDYALSSVKTYDDPYLYKNISSLVKGENFYILSSNIKGLLASVQEKYPFVQDIIVHYQKANTIFVKVLFEPPQLVVSYNNMRFGVYKDELFQLFSGNMLGSGSMNIEVLSFSSGSNYLTGLFFHESSVQLLDDIHTLNAGLSGISHISYLPGAHRMILNIGKQNVYVNNAIDIQPQITNYHLLKKYYSDFPQLKEIDLGSLEADKVIVSK